MGFRSLELASLVDSCIDASVCDEFIEGFKAVDITDFGQDSCASNRTNAGNGSDMLWDLLHQFGDRLVNSGTLLFEQVDLSQQAAHFDADNLHQKGNPDRE